MDWFSAYDVRIDCKNKKVTLRVSEKVKVKFRGQRQTNKFFIDYSRKKDVV